MVFLISCKHGEQPKAGEGAGKRMRTSTLKLSQDARVRNVICVRALRMCLLLCSVARLMQRIWS